MFRFKLNINLDLQRLSLIFVCVLAFNIIRAQTQPTDYTTLEITAIQSALNAAEGDLYYDFELDVYYIGLTSGRLKPIGNISGKGTSVTDALRWDDIANQWTASGTDTYKINLEKEIVKTSKQTLIRVDEGLVSELPNMRIVNGEVLKNQINATIGTNQISGLEGAVKIEVQLNFLSSATNANINCILYINNVAEQRVFGSNFIKNLDDNSAASTRWIFEKEDVELTDVFEIVLENETTTNLPVLMSQDDYPSQIIIEQFDDVEVITDIGVPVNLELQQGLAGVQGPQGPQGEQGLPGEDVSFKPVLISVFPQSVPRNATATEIRVTGFNFDQNTVFEILGGSSNITIVNTEIVSGIEAVLTLATGNDIGIYPLYIQESNPNEILPVNVKDVITLIPGSAAVPWENVSANVATGLGTMESSSNALGWDKQATFGSVPANTNCSLSFTYAGITAMGIRFSFAMAGFGIDPAANASFNRIDHAFYIVNSSRLLIYENGGRIVEIQGVNLSVNDTFEIRRINTIVTYYYNGSLVYTSYTPSTGVLHFDSSINRDTALKDIKMVY